MKALEIAFKDTLTRFRDWKALVGMLAAPLMISALIGLAFGNFSSDEAPIENIRMALVNLDDGELGQAYEDVLTSPDLESLIALEISEDAAAAKARIESGELRAVLVIPADFSETVIPDGEGESGTASVELYTDPAASVSPIIVKSIVERISASINTMLLAGSVSGDRIAPYAPLLGAAMATLGEAIGAELQSERFDFQEPTLSLEMIATGEDEEPFDPFAFFIPGMAVFFLMFSMFEGSRSILQEERNWTLQRLMSTPTPNWQIILGKMGGTFLTGLLQFIVLVLSSALLFGVNWGHSILGLLIMVVLTVFAASGLGAMLTAFSRNENQAGVVGSAVSLVFGALGGSFFPTDGLTGIVNLASKLTVNRWAMDGLLALTVERGGLADIQTPALVLAVIGLVTFGLALMAFQKRFVK
ncbi:MAG: ABC transporter permease [Anaerolineales bacterium]|jgi:ABC-2 type transport system permease protein|nr:ABC transporter permease [Anaerolineales bacterium]